MNTTATPDLETFPKLPLGGIDRRSIVDVLATQGPAIARADLAASRAALRPVGTDVGRDACVLMLGGSNGILRALAIQLLLGEKVAVHCVHYDSEKLQIGPHHARAITAAAIEAGVGVSFRNADATKPDVIREVTEELAKGYRAVHVVNGIASGATKRYAQHGPTKVKDLDVAFDPVRQVPDFSRWESVRRVGLVDVDVATEQDIERTNKMMGTSTEAWTDALGAKGLIAKGESVVAFADYDYEPDDPVYAMGPLAGAKIIQRASMKRIGERWGVRTARICYPAMNTTALGAIPGASLMFAGTAQLLLERGTYRDLATLARDTVPLFQRGFASDELRVDEHYRAVLGPFRGLAARLDNGNVRELLARVVGHAGL